MSAAPVEFREEAGPPPKKGAVICVYGPSGIGKTVDAGYAAPRGCFIAAPGALESIQAVCGYVPAQNQTATTIPKATELLRSLRHQFDTVVVDDFSFLADQTIYWLEHTKKRTGFDLWGDLRDAALEFRDAARYAGINVILNAWEQGPRVKDKNKIRGGPLLPSKLPELVPAMCDIVLQAVHDKRRAPWPAVYHCATSADYVMKDRYNITALCHPAPMNLGELMRASGLSAPRHPEIPEQEAMVEAISAELKGSLHEDISAVNTLYADMVAGGMSVPVVRWTLRDALDRATIRRAVAASQSTFINPSGLTL